jgi:hypothetical protein
MSSNVMPFAPPGIIEMVDAHHQDISAINLAFKMLDEHQREVSSLRADIGGMLLEVRKEIEAEGKNWWKWYEEPGRFIRGRKDAEKLMALGRAEDPEEAAKAERERNRKASAAYRTRKSAPADVSGNDDEIASAEEIEAMIEEYGERKEPDKGSPEVVEVEDPKIVTKNILDTIGRHKAVAEAYRKVIKLSSGLDREAIAIAINSLITKWNSVFKALEKREP